MYGKKFLRQWLWHSLMKLCTKKLWKSVNICKSYRKKISGTFFFWTRCTFAQPYEVLHFVANICIHFDITAVHTKTCKHVKCPCSVFNAKCHYNLYFFNNNNNNNTNQKERRFPPKPLEQNWTNASSQQRSVQNQ